MKQKIELFDTTLRDGTQGEGISLSLHDKLMITQKLDEFGIDIIEGGWPGSNPKDAEYFHKVKELNLHNAKICAFGSTARFPDKIESDNNLQKLIEADTEIISIFGKTWRFHSKKTLGLTDKENEKLIFDSINYLKLFDKKIIFDAEHFFDGYKDDPLFALKMIKAAERAGADIITLCDTNGGSLPNEISEIVRVVSKNIDLELGIHAHNDGEFGVANTLAAVNEGIVHIQGTINGVGERCGNANLCSIIPNLILKMGYESYSDIKVENITAVSNYIYEVMNLVPNTRAAFVGKSAFAHKGGIHVSSVLKDSRMYEHIPPKSVGNKQRVIISDLSGQSNLRYKAKELGIKLPLAKEFSEKFVANIKSLEYEGYQFDGAEASFELRLRNDLEQFDEFFHIEYASVEVMFSDDGQDYAEAVLKVVVNGETEHTAADGKGPVNALDNALRKALRRFYPEIAEIKLVDYKVRVLGEKNGTAAKVRVLIESSDNSGTWSTVGVNENIIHASLQAISDSINYKLFKNINDFSLKRV